MAESKKAGRPRKGEGPNVPWTLVEQALVFGEATRDEQTGLEYQKYPSYGEIAKRYSISKGTVFKFSQKHKCLKRRKELAQATDDAFKHEFVKTQVQSRILQTSELVGICDEYLIQCREALEKKTMRTSNPADMNTVARLREFLLGRADSRRETNGVVSLEVIQVRHAERIQARAALPDSVSGIVPALPDPIDALAEVVSTDGEGGAERDVLGELLKNESGDPIAASGQ